MSDRTTPTDGNPPAPEERYEAANSVDWHEAYDSAEKVEVLRDMCIALRDMIASQDAELARLTETVNRQEREYADDHERIIDLKKISERGIDQDADLIRRITCLETEIDTRTDPDDLAILAAVIGGETDG